MIKYFTARTLVRELHELDVVAFVELMTHPHVSKYLNSTGDALEESSAEMALKHVINNYCSNEPVNLFAVVKKDVPKKMIGLISYKQLQQYEAELFGALLPQFWGAKISNEMVEGLIQYVFENTSISRLVVYIKQDNRSAKALVQKLGFIDEGLVYNSVFEDDAHLLSITKPSLLQKAHTV